MTKLEGLLRRLLLLRQTVPDEKALVFSQFPAALELVGCVTHIDTRLLCPVLICEPDTGESPVCMLCKAN